jgi:hypothetical protein
MSSKAPPVPPANQSPKGPGSASPAPVDTAPHQTASNPNPDQTGRGANIKQNTTNQGHQQDR